MRVIPTALPDVLILEPIVHTDERGFFYESYNQKDFEESTGIKQRFVQDNHSRSTRNVLRGLHYQIHQPQGKLIRVVVGEIFDVVVDIRRSSPTFGQWAATRLSADNKRELWVPVGYAHGFLVVSDDADCLYKTTDYWAREHERCIRWDDPDIGINWPVRGKPFLSAKDLQGMPLSHADVFP